MSRYVIERQYLLPVYEQLLTEAPNFEAACRAALDKMKHPWTGNAEHDFDNARSVTITQAVELPEGEPPELHSDKASLGEILYNSGLSQLPIAIEFTQDAEHGEPIGFV